MVSVQLSQLKWVILVAKVSKLEVHEALVKVRQSLCCCPKMVNFLLLQINDSPTFSLRKYATMSHSIYNFTHTKLANRIKWGICKLLYILT